MQTDLSPSRQIYAAAALLAEQDANKVLTLARTWDAEDTALASVTTRALERIAAVNPIDANIKLSAFINSIKLSDSDQTRVRSALTRTVIIANTPDAGAWLDALPANARDAQTHEWGVRRLPNSNDRSLQRRATRRCEVGRPALSKIPRSLD